VAVLGGEERRRLRLRAVYLLSCVGIRNGGSMYVDRLAAESVDDKDGRVDSNIMG
jgi:hypothetical protein